jgi:hypothetical protein
LPEGPATARHPLDTPVSPPVPAFQRGLLGRAPLFRVIVALSVTFFRLPRLSQTLAFGNASAPVAHRGWESSSGGNFWRRNRVRALVRAIKTGHSPNARSRVWTPMAFGYSISESRAGYSFPPSGAGNPVRSLLPAMTPQKSCRLSGCALTLFVLLLLLASTASASWKEKVLYSFQGGADAGSVPAGGVIFDKQGNLYVATTDGGPPSCAPIGGACGTVYQLSPPAKKGDPWTATLIRMFEARSQTTLLSPRVV